jgi:hypothetical protein
MSEQVLEPGQKCPACGGEIDLMYRDVQELIWHSKCFVCGTRYTVPDSKHTWKFAHV